jgi:hypothetical protein
MHTGSKLALSTALVLSLVSAPSAHALYITELLALNTSTNTDEDGTYADWVEIHNESGLTASLAGYYLTDDDDLLTKWQFPSVSIPAGGYLLVWASNKNRTNPLLPLHTNFALGGSGEYLALVAPDGTAVVHEYAPQYPQQTANRSYGLAGDLATERCFRSPTPGAANDESTSCSLVDEVQFSVERGFYDASFSVALSTPTPAATIHYTLDGSDPTPTNGAVYTTPVSVATTTMLRAMAFLTGSITSPSVTHTYVFLDEVLVQDGAGMPQTWEGDYAMDPRVVNDPRYAATIRDDLLAVPTLSLVMNVDDWFGDTNGIYSHPHRKGIEWERPVSAELIHSNGSEGFQINCGVRIQGRLSREKNPKKSFRLAFKSDYGPSKLDYPLFSDTRVRSFDKLRLRASHNKGWSFGVLRADYIRDQWARDSQIDMGQVASHGIFAHVYVNGLYWGLYNVVEHPDEGFAEGYFGGEKETWDVLKAGLEVVNGTRDAWDAAQAIAQAGVSTPAAYAALRQYVDVDNLIDYMIVNMHAGTLDWDDSNWFAAGNIGLGEPFRFFSWDAEQSMEIIWAKRTGVGNQGQPSGFYRPLRDNAEFRLLFGDHVHRHFFNSGALTRERSVDRYMARAAEIDRAIVAESARWGDARHKSDPLTRDDDWLEEVEWLRLAYFPRRSAIVLDQFREIDLYPSLDAPILSQHGGSVSPGFTLTIAAPSGTVFYTTDGSDPRLEGGALSPAATAYAAPIAIAAETTIKARASIGSSWSALTEATFLVDGPLRVTEVMFHPQDPAGPSMYEDDDFEFVEVANVGNAPVPLTGTAFVTGIAFAFPAVTLDPGEHALVVRNLAAFESRYGTGLPVVGEYGGGLDNDGERIRWEDSGGGAILDFVYNDRWHPNADGAGRSLRIVDASAPVDRWSERAAWRASPLVDGSPGAAELPMCADTVDNDGDGLADYPDDPGCAAASQDDEGPHCNDGIDNDEDGAVDLADSRCSTASGEAEEVAPIDRFACFAATSSGPVSTGASVTLEDAIDPPGPYETESARSVCVPASVEGEPIVDPSTHLLAHPIRPAPGTPAHVPQEAFFARGLGPIFLDTVRPDRLLVPSAASLTSEVTAPDNSSHAVDHYKCYKAKAASQAPAYFPKGAQLHLANTIEGRTYDVRRITRLCVPVSKNGEGIKNPDGLLLCYQARQARGQALHETVSVHTNNQLGPDLLQTRRIEEVCVPAKHPTS